MPPAPSAPSRFSNTLALTSDHGKSQVGGVLLSPSHVVGNQIAIEPADYRQYALDALGSGNAEHAFLAAQQIRICAFNEEFRVGVERLRSTGKLPPDRSKEIIERAELEMRRCQTLTPDVSAKGEQLARMALLGQQVGAAALFLSFRSGVPDEAIKVETLSALQRDASLGERDAIFLLAANLGRWNLTGIEQRAYFLAAESAGLDGMPGLIARITTNPYISRLTDLEEKEAQAMADGFIQRLRMRMGERP